ncbi:MAG: hypothetical protein E6I74_08050 [Chloroflexi bacterium]|nr:MAG: hypothetical protein E6I74_08050 [Chloroflexota bacterium]
MKRLTSATLTTIAVLVLASVTASAQNRLPNNAQRGLQWLQCTQQQSNGQIGSGGNPIARSSEVAFGLAAAGQDAAAMKTGGVSLADYLKTAVSTDVGTNGELLIARASQTHAGPTAAVITQLQAAKGSNGEYGADLYSDALAILGLRAANQAVGQDAVTFLKDHQQPDGGWGFGGDQYTDSNTTALVIQALLSAGLPSADGAITHGFAYLQSVFGQGGFADAPGAAPDGNSDELAIQAILAANQEADQTWRSKLDQALAHLAGLQVGSGVDAGAISNPYSKLFATTFAPAAFLLRPLTSSGIAETATSLLACPVSSTATPTPTPVATAKLAQTGGAADIRPPLAGLALLLLGTGVLMRPRRRAPSR